MRTLADLRHAIRLLLKTPAITLAAVLSLALGIGANTAIFSAINVLLLRSLPVENPERLVRIGAVDPRQPKSFQGLSLAMLEQIRQTGIFSNVFGWLGGGVSNFEVNGNHYSGSLDEVAGDYFATLGVRPAVGRLLTSADDAPSGEESAAQVVVIGYGCWQHRFGGDPGVIGKTIRIDDKPLMIVGVTPEKFTGIIVDIAEEATVPIGFTGRPRQYRKDRFYDTFARLRPGMSLSQARTRLEALWPGILKATVPDSEKSDLAAFLALRVNVEPGARGNSYLRERLEKPLEILIALAAAVLLITCVNVANVMLARSAARRHEIAIRVALGAARWPLVRVMLAEALLLSAAGATIGLLMSGWTARYLLRSLWSGFVPLILDPSPDAWVLGFATMLAMLTTLLSGVVPAWRMSDADPSQVLGQGPRTTGGHSRHFGQALVIAQATLSLVLLVGSALFVRSLRNLETVDLGYHRDHLLLLQMFPLPGRATIPNRPQYLRDVVERVSGMSGIESASYLHMGPATSYEYKVQVTAGPGIATQRAAEEWAGPDLFKMIGMPVLAGREFGWQDDEHSQRVAIVSESLAGVLFSDQNPIGRKIDVGADPERRGLTIIGVVNSASLWRLDSRQPLAVYHALLQEPRYNQPRLIVRTRGDPRAIAGPVEKMLESAGHHYSLWTETLEQRTARTLVIERMIATLASAFGVLALVLAAVGLYGVLSYSVTLRNREIGLRMALGATRAKILRMVLTQVLVNIAIGILITIPIILLAGNLIAGFLFGVPAADPVAIAVSCSILVTVAVLAAFVPARRAARVEPMIALRSE